MPAARAEEPSPPPLPASVAIPLPLLDKLAFYLQERPYREVAPLLAALQQAVNASLPAAKP